MWINENLELMIVDYKATSKDNPIRSSNELYSAYKRQIDIYRWIFEKNNFKVAKESVFIYCNGLKNKPFFKRHLEFSVNLIFYIGSTSWIEPILEEIHEALMKNHAPKSKETCEYCKYAIAANTISF